MGHFSMRRAHWVPALLLAAAAVGCEDTKTVFVDVPVEVPVEVPRALYTEPPEGAANFLGYNDAALTNPTCAECHAEIGGKWKGTAHAEAWAGLQSSANAAPFCEVCHTTAEYGNSTTEVGGWTGTQDARYHDVQCEACHGPGQDHVDTGTNPPLASIAVPFTIDGTGAVLPGTNGCGECHSDTHHPFIEEWSLSDHAKANETSGARDPSRYCVGCHTGQGALLAWGVTSNYIEKEWTVQEEAQPIVCAVCHNPHDAAFEGQTRFAVHTDQIDQHLCAQCHDRRAIPDPGSSHGLHPHAPEAAMLGGEAGFFFPGMPVNPGQIIATHGSAANDELCAGCHVFSYTIQDEGGGFLFSATGHTFAPIPCVDAEGIPTGDKDCELSTAARSFNSCTVAGCHGSVDVAFSALTAARLRIENLVTELEELLAQVDPNGEDPFDGVDPATGIIDASDGVITTGEGAFFNMELALHPTGDRVWAQTVHNPWLLETLLLVSIDRVETEYGVGGGGASVAREAQLQQVLQKAGVR